MVTGKRSILLVCKNIPYPPYTGGNVRVFNLVKRMARDYDITLVCLSDRQAVGDAEGLRPWCCHIHVVPIVTGRSVAEKLLLLCKPAEWRRFFARAARLLRGAPFGMLCSYFPAMRDLLRSLLASGRYDIVQFESIVGIYLPDVEDLLGEARTVYVEHGLIGEEIARMIHRSGWGVKLRYALEPLLFNIYERKLLPRFDHIISMSELEREKIMRLTGIPERRITVVRTGVDTELYRDRAVPDRERCMALLGTMRFVPNREGFIWFAERVFPKIRRRVPDATVLVVGEEDPEITKQYSRPGIIFRGVVERLEDEFGKGMIFLAPIRIGAGTRTKIVTGMAFGMPVVSASVGIEGIAAAENEGVIIADDESDFANAVVGLLEDDARRLEMGAMARAYVEREYSWNQIYLRLNQVYRDLVVLPAKSLGKEGESRVVPMSPVPSAKGSSS